MKKTKAFIYDLMIVGAGPAGILSAYQCGKAGLSVLLIDKNAMIGKKILSTGNGKCNLTNLSQESAFYRSQNPAAAWEYICQYDCKQYLDSLQEFGILTRDKNGYIYPYNEQATTVREAYESALKANPNISILTDCEVLRVKYNHKGQKLYSLQTSRGIFQGRSLLIATGGLAAPKLGSTGDGYDWAKQFGHHLILAKPALTALKSGAPFLKKLAGVRNQAEITLYIEDQPFISESGELQWTDYGISGVAIFQISRYAVAALEEGKKVSLSLDLAIDYKEEELNEVLLQFKERCPYKTVEQILHGILPFKLCGVIAREARIEQDRLIKNIDIEEIEKLSQAIKAFTLRIQGYMGYDKAQVTQGGVALQEVDRHMQSIYAPGLFFAGEILDVDGCCGGYNLQWAYSSAMAAAQGIIAYLK